MRHSAPTHVPTEHGGNEARGGGAGTLPSRSRALIESWVSLPSRSFFGNSWGVWAPASGATAWSVALFLADMLLVPLTTSVLADAFHLPAQDLGLFAELRGNTVRYLLLLIPVSRGSVAFGEELLSRGFFARRLADAFGGAGRAKLSQPSDRRRCWGVVMPLSVRAAC